MKALNTIFKYSISADDYLAEKRFCQKVFVATAIVGLIGAFAFLINPSLDFILTNWINQGEVFALSGSSLWAFIRRALMIGFAIAYLLFVLGLIRSIKEQTAIWKMQPVAWLYLVLSSLIGPLLISNIVLKTFIGRPRPRSVTEYGGQLDFVGVFEAGGKCIENCSFVSGEVSSMVMIIAGLMFACLPFRRLFLWLLIPSWALSAYVRIGMGGHFPSDTFFAGIFMVMIAAGLYRLIVLSPRNVEIKN